MGFDAAELQSDALRRRCDAKALGFATTEEVPRLDRMVGQPRAMEALDFALAEDAPGFNVFVTGPTGTGRHSALRDRLAAGARERPAPDDVVYVHNFADPQRPLGIALPSGRGKALADQMAGFVQHSREEIPRAFESEGYQRRRTLAVEELNRQRDAGIRKLREHALKLGIALEIHPPGVVTMPIVQGRPVTPQEFERLPEERKEAFRSAQRELEGDVTDLSSRLHRLDHEAAERISALDREVALFAVGHLIDELLNACPDHAVVRDWLERVREDVIDNLPRFRTPLPPTAEMPPPVAMAMERTSEDFFGRYTVNVFTSHADGEAAPVIHDGNPTYPSLFGRIQYRSNFGAVSTDHRDLRAGAIHRANGGYLILDAADLLTRPLLRDKLKQSLREHEARLENLGDQFTLFPTATITPEPLDLDVKVVLVGSADLYRLLYVVDEDVRDLFRVRAEFDVDMAWSDEGVGAYASFVAAQVQDGALRHFDAEAVAALVEHTGRARRAIASG